ncbi:MAG: hypothetical protein M1829_004928 [Trizodia sp. TS-e1964]|nr:MAG: hypothetical protein M1829_004928 [Trizodia sp. TS-e1964]
MALCPLNLPRYSCAFIQISISHRECEPFSPAYRCTPSPSSSSQQAPRLLYPPALEPARTSRLQHVLSAVTTPSYYEEPSGWHTLATTNGPLRRVLVVTCEEEGSQVPVDCPDGLAPQLQSFRVEVDGISGRWAPFTLAMEPPQERWGEHWVPLRWERLGVLRAPLKKAYQTIAATQVTAPRQTPVSASFGVTEEWVSAVVKNLVNADMLVSSRVEPSL